MTHQPLALKYRPATFADVIAQDHVTRTLCNALDRGRVGPAYLFAGPRGSGKTTTARLLAKALNCGEGISGEPCGKCENCVSIAAGRSLDVIEIDAASNRGIDDIKELRETAKYAAAQGRYKVYIVDEVHQLSKDAFNAFLKTLEEPPRNVVFVLATTEAHKILPTILSRCQRFDFRPIPLPAIRGRIEDIAVRESFDLAEEAAFAIARKADGSLRDALSLLDQVVAFGGDSIDLETLRRLIGMPDEERYLELTDLLAAGDAAGTLGAARRLREAGYDLEEFYGGFLEHLRNCLLFALGAADGAVEVPSRWREAYVEAAERLGADDLLRMLTLATDEEPVFRRSGQQGLVLEVLLVRLALLDRSVDIDDALAALDGGGGRPGGGREAPARASRGSAPGSKPRPGGVRAETAATAPSRASSPGPSAPAASPSAPDAGRSAPRAAADSGQRRADPGPLTLEVLAGEWDTVLDAIHALRPTVAAALREARPAGCSGERVTLTLPAEAEFRLEALSQRGTLDSLVTVLGERWGWAGAIEVRSGDSPAAAATGATSAAEAAPAPETPAEAPPPQATAREIRARDLAARVEDDPLLKQVVELFDANVVRVRRSSPARP